MTYFLKQTSFGFMRAHSILVMTVSLFFPIFLRKLRVIIAVNSSIHLGMDDFETSYISEKKVTSFRKRINLFGIYDDKDVILESYSKEERANLTSLDNSPRAFFACTF